MEDKIIEMEDGKVVEAKKESKFISGVKKVGSVIRNNWKPIVVGGIALVIGYAAGSRNSDEADSETAECDEFDASDIEENDPE